LAQNGTGGKNAVISGFQAKTLFGCGLTHMKKFPIYFCIFTIVLLPLINAIAAEPVLIRLDKEPDLSLIRVATFSGDCDGQLTPATPSSKITATIFLDTLLPEKFEEIKSKLMDLHSAIKEKKDLTFLFITSNGSELRGPFVSRSSLQIALKAIFNPAVEDDPPKANEVPDAYTQLGSLMPTPGEWANLLIVGAFPAPEPGIKEYLASYLSNHFRAMRLRVSHWAPGETSPSIFDAISVETGGFVGLDMPADLVVAERDSGIAFAELKWGDPVLTSGFYLYQARVQDVLPGNRSLQFSSFARAPGFQLPPISRYKELRDRAASLSTTLRKAGIKPEDLDPARMTLNEALAINPSDEEALSAAADIFEQGGSPEEAAVYLSTLSDLQTGNRDVFARLGDLYFRTGNFAASESSLMKARRLQAAQPFVTKELGQIAAGKGEHANAIPLFNESLKANPEDAETWFLRAASASQIGDRALQAESLERGLAILPDQLVHRTELVQLYLGHKEYEKALHHIQPILKDPPPDAAVCESYAGFLEQAKQPDTALILWKKTRELDPKLEPAHWGIVHILLDNGDFRGCIEAADAGFVYAPSSPRLYLAKAEAQERLELWYEARRTLQKGAGIADDPELMRHFAETEDQYGQDAGRAYHQAAVACESHAQSGQNCSSLLRRGFLVSIRDGDRASTEWFAYKLRSVGQREATAILGEKVERKFEIRIPGGMDAILRLLGEREHGAPEDFLRDYSKTLVQLGNTKAARDLLQENISRHFEVITSLEFFGHRDKDRTRVELSVSDSAAKKRTQKALGLLGWEISGKSEIVPVTGSSAARRQQTSAALAIDEIAMQEALNAGKTYTLEISNDWVFAIRGEAPWRDQFYAKRNYPGGFAQALAEDFDLAKLFVGISDLDEGTSEELIKDFGLKTLYDKYADLLFGHASNLVVRDGHAAVPGGHPAEPVWEKAIGASPTNPRKFFKDLLRKDDGKMLAFYSCLMQLDLPHQKFFSASDLRLKHFYELFRESPEVSAGNRRSTPFQDFITQVPIDSELHIQFPGSPEVWMVAKGQSGSERQITKMLKKVERIGSQDVEDKILLRLARTEFSMGMEDVSELANFMAVVRVDAHHHEPLDEASALLLAQQHSYYRAIWPYLMSLSDLSFKEYSLMFRVGSKLRDLDSLMLNNILGEFNAIAKLLCLMQEFKGIDGKRTALIFGSYCERLMRAVTNADYALAALDAIQEIIKAAGGSDADPDSAICDLLIRPDEPIAMEIRGKRTAPTANHQRRDGYRQSIEYQKVPSLNAIFALRAAAEKLASGGGRLLDHVKQLESQLATFPEVVYAKSSGLEKTAKENMSGLELGKLRELTQDLREAASKKKPNLKKIASRSREFIDELNPQVRLALTGILYAFYFRPTDLLISEDPFFLRKHQFLQLDRPKDSSIFYSTELKPDEKVGSFLVGGFAAMSKTAGEVSMATSRKFQDDAKPFASTVLASLRDVNWQVLTNKDLRITGLRIRAAREWVVRSATDPNAMSELADAIEGMLSASRRASLIRAISRLQWDSVWDMLSAGDLFFLGEEYLIRFKDESENSPTISALKQHSADKAFGNLHWLGPELSSIYECSHAHLLRLPPYENFENLIFPDKMAERSNEFKLYLAELFDRTGIPAAFLESIAEPTAMKLFAGIRLNGPKDWKTIMRTYAKMKDPWGEIEAKE
jgi:tetratricopeptide (TPR) repeat protein